VKGGIDRRQGERLKVCCKLEILATGDRAAVSPYPALTVDISSGGICANTPTELKAGQFVDIVLDTSEAGVLGLPKALRGRAEVRRVEQHEGGWRMVAFAFAPAFAQSMEMAFFIAFLCGLQHGGGAAAFA